MTINHYETIKYQLLQKFNEIFFTHYKTKSRKSYDCLVVTYEMGLIKLKNTRFVGSVYSGQREERLPAIMSNFHSVLSDVFLFAIVQ